VLEGSVGSSSPGGWFMPSIISNSETSRGAEEVKASPLALDEGYGPLISMSVFVVQLIPPTAFELLIFLCDRRVGVACRDI
jgi:hypothetical protein